MGKKRRQQVTGLTESERFKLGAVAAIENTKTLEEEIARTNAANFRYTMNLFYRRAGLLNNLKEPRFRVVKRSSVK